MRIPDGVLPDGWSQNHLNDLECPCGHWVELDGSCPNGHESPLKKMGMI